ncbi:probable carbohydrate esterase At4g34215 isoform X2 [Ananas comosus]|uniref:Probable carbohydrate esterase At4g34215 isoform X2 n=1 Tax=Ananas comosus TaxID=4615 RepID=A0A6P5FM04_ANACO|nr:probable carbohydrate esterase At4g34215 isoform X2 [Ananas comosus]
MLLSFLSLLLLLASAAAAVAEAEAEVEVEEEMVVFVLAGQSNMAGRGGVVGDRWDGDVPPECRPSPSILRLSAALRWEEAREPLHADIDRARPCGVGPGLPFASALRRSAAATAAAEGPGAEAIGLVPCAVGGTRIDEWARGAPLYAAMVRRARAALERGEGRRTRRLGAVLWYQGESDTVERSDAESYGGKLETMILDLRSDLGLPGLLFIQVAIASGEGNFTEIVRKAQKGLKLPNVICVDAKGLPLEGDHLHLTTQAQVQLGTKAMSFSTGNRTKAKFLCGLLVAAILCIL